MGPTSKTENTVGEILKAAIGVVTSGVGAYIALVLKDRFDLRGKARAADAEEFKKASAWLNDQTVAVLRSTEFYSGLDRRRLEPIDQLTHAYEGNRSVLFHDSELNALFLELLADVTTFRQEVAKLTVPEGDPVLLTTTSRANRLYGGADAKRQSIEEANALDAGARRLADKGAAFIDRAKRQLKA
ncbi:hypothetical protein PQQ53_14175 [Paraburkholderia strydomiana]|jgi:hypothetical protein|uniref:hypothetical protein n=1 Tax=Paraburkholderia strydomiana TaxID=1245417 RepID=UPI0038B7D2E7